VNSFVLIWDGSGAGYDPQGYADDIAATSRQEEVRIQWSFGSRRGGAAAGDRVYLLRQHTNRGIVASGHLESGSVGSGEHWNDPKKTAYYVDVIWDAVVSPEDRLPIEQLLSGIDGHNWNNVYGSGQILQPETATKLERAWQQHLTALGSPIS
jgi:hypothetical protein